MSKDATSTDDESSDFARRKLEGELVVEQVDEEDVDGESVDGENIVVGDVEDSAKLGFFARISLFFQQVVVELRKTIWPTASETVRYTFVVLVFVCVAVAALAGFDVVVGHLLIGNN